MVPKQITTPMGIHSEVCATIIGMTPKAVVADVRKMGRIRRLPASKAASRAVLCCSLRSISAYSNMMMALRTMIPMRLTTPSTAVILKSSWKIHNPRQVPKMQMALAANDSRAMSIFVK